MFQKLVLLVSYAELLDFSLLSFYVVYNGIVYTTYYDYDDIHYKKDKFGIFAQLNGDKYQCFYHEEPANNYSLIAKYSNIIQRQYNYDKDLVASYKSDEFQSSKEDPNI